MAPDRTGPARIAFAAGDVVDVELAHDVAERAGIDLAAAADAVALRLALAVSFD